MPRVSVIIATYNCSATLGTAVDSILAQTMQDFEIVACDDCSTDETYAILKQYERENPEKVVVLRNGKNSKLPYSLNRCLEVAKGEYIARMDGDDISAPDRFEKQVAFLDARPEYDLVGTDMLLFDEHGEFGTIKASRTPSPKDLLMSTPFCHATIMMRASAYKALGGYTVAKRTIRGQDVDLWFRFFAGGYTGYNLPQPLYRVREDRNAQKRRKLKFRIYEAQTRLIGFRQLHFPVYQYVYAVLPVIKFFIPKKLKLVVQKQNKV